MCHWLFPLPNQMDMWPNFRSPLLWDVFAVSTYASVSLVFWYMGMIPDLATLRDRASNNIRKIAYGIFAIGWTGSSRHWHRYERAYLLLAALSTPLVLSVHSVVSFDFAVYSCPAGTPRSSRRTSSRARPSAVSPWRHARGAGPPSAQAHHHDESHRRDARILMASTARRLRTDRVLHRGYGGVQYESFAFVNRAFGNYWWAYWIMVSCNVIFPQIFWSKKMRRNLWVVMLVSITTNIGMWFERFVITVTSLSRDFLPSSWGYFSPTWVDMCMFLGSFDCSSRCSSSSCASCPPSPGRPSIMPQATRRQLHPRRRDHDHASAGGASPARRSSAFLSPPEQTSPMSDSNEKLHGIVAYFTDIDGLMAAARKVRDAGYKRWDSYTPFPVHGIDDAMGIKPTILPWIVLVMGLTGLSLGILLQWYTNAFDYVFLISGKPDWSLPANIPVAFEMVIAFSAFTTFLGMLALNKLPHLSNPLHKLERFRRITRCFDVVEAADKNSTPVFARCWAP